MELHAEGFTVAWKVDSVVEQRQEFVALAAAEGANVSELCRRFGIARKTGYKWLARHRVLGAEGLADRSRRPERSPERTAAEIEERVVALRKKHPAWGGRKLRRRLADLGMTRVPAASTITGVLRRHGLLERTKPHPQAWRRFERERPNELWQMDFKGHFAMRDGGRCHPLTVLDDCSRYSLTIQACDNERTDTVREALVAAFRRYGLPEAMLTDNGSPWGDDAASRWTPLGVWLARLGVRSLHGRPYHPQTQGKEERFHRTLKAETLNGDAPKNLADSQRRFDRWRHVYNAERPHEALGLATPASRYRMSARSYPERLPEMEFSPIDVVRKVGAEGRVSFGGRTWRVCKAFRGERVGVRPTTTDGVFDVWFGVNLVRRLDARQDDDGLDQSCE